MKKRKRIKVWVVIPDQVNLATQYCRTEGEARDLSRYLGGGVWDLIEQFEDIVTGKGYSQAKGKDNLE